MANKNADRFLGFADVYENARPRVPAYPAKVLCRYLGRRPQTVVDLGCGTGLSTEIWPDYADTVIGVEPSEDMFAVAAQKTTDVMTFRHGTGEATGLPDECADIVICSQSFHWMEPVATLREVDRILKSDGVFATVDCDWPAVTKWQAEKAYMDLYTKVKQIESAVPESRASFTHYDKKRHLQNIQNCGAFVYTRELLFASEEICTKQRFKDIIMSQGSLQAILKRRPELIEEDVAAFSAAIDKIYDDQPFSIEFCYRMRVGIKSPTA